MYNKELAGTLCAGFSVLSHELESFASDKDLYAYIASVIYNKLYEECKEMYPDGTPNPDGKDLRTRVKQFLLPIVIECGGLFEEDKLSPEDAKKWAEEYKDMCINPDKES